MKVITISGRARHGKDTLANIIEKELTSEGYKVLITHYADLLKYICKQYFNWNGKKDKAGRTLLQYVGTDVVRKAKPDFWVSFMADFLTIFKSEWDVVIIPDTRFPNEVQYLKDAGLDVIHCHINRTNFDDGMTEEQRNHISETAIFSIQPDFCFDNDGNLNDLKHKVTEWTEEIIVNGKRDYWKRIF